jgi:hypothetical protein
MFNNKPELTKELIFKHVSQEEIFFYYGLPVTSEKIVNPFRKDKQPGCSFYKTEKGVIIFKDFASQINWDCFGLVNHILGEVSFYKVLERICKDFNIDYRLKKESSVIYIKPTDLHVPNLETARSTIEISPKQFNEVELSYWLQYGISKEILTYYDVTACNAVWLNNKIIYRYRERDICFAYRFQSGIYKIYFPLRNRYKWLSNVDNTLIQGYKQLKKEGDIVLYTKSMKDVMCLSSLDFNAIAPQTEVQFLSIEQHQEIKQRFKQQVLFYDNDETGIKMSMKYSEAHDIPYILLPTDTEKDISDFYKRYGKDASEDILFQLLNTNNFS